MRFLALLAVLALLVSAIVAPRVYRDRPGIVLDRTFVEPDPRTRALWGDEHEAMGVAMFGYEEWVAQGNPPAKEALLGQIRLGFRLGALAMDQPNIHKLVLLQARAYIEHRDRIDPDGSALQAMLEDWVAARAVHPYYHASMAANLYMAARGDRAAGDRLMKFSEGIPFHTMLFIYARRHKPAWRAVEPFARRYLESGQLEAVVEAGTALLEYNVLLGSGQELLDRFLPDIRAALREMKGKMTALKATSPLAAHAQTAMFGLAMLANMGYVEEKRILKRLGNGLLVPLLVEELRVAQTWAGVRPLRAMAPPGREFDTLRADLREHFFRAAAHRAAVLQRRPPTSERDAEIDFALRVVENGYREAHFWTKLYCLHALAALDRRNGPRVLSEVIDGGGVPSIFAATLAPEVEDKVAVYLGGLSSPEPDYSAIAAISLLDLDNDLRCLELPNPKKN